MTGNGQDLLRTPAPGPGDPPPPAPAAGPGDQRQDQRPDTSDRRRQDRQQQRKRDGKRGKRPENGPPASGTGLGTGHGTAPACISSRIGPGTVRRTAAGAPGRAPPASGRAGLLQRRNKGAPPQSGGEEPRTPQSLSATSIRISILDLDFGFGG